jgi:hypothetical protein
VIDSVPASLQLIYGVANVTLNILNIFWFMKMMDAISRRFPKDGKSKRTKADTKDIISSGESWEDSKTKRKNPDIKTE